MPAFSLMRLHSRPYPVNKKLFPFFSLTENEGGLDDPFFQLTIVISSPTLIS
jgi:hypothetical protein